MGRQVKTLKALICLGIACVVFSLVFYKKSSNPMLHDAVWKVSHDLKETVEIKSLTSSDTKDTGASPLRKSDNQRVTINARNEQGINREYLQKLMDNSQHGSKSNVSTCDVKSLQLIGPKTAVTINKFVENPPTFGETARANPELSEGGRYFPKDCQPKFKVAIIIPYRGRELQLRGLLAHMHPVWQRQGIDYTVYTVIQAGSGLFNKGKLMNAGFLEASKERIYDCYVFHDVDLLLENDGCLYWCPDESKVVHMPVYMDKFGYQYLRYYPKCMTPRFRPGPIVYFGGITMFTLKQFVSVNGFSNMFWGWGGEDDDASLRVKRGGYVILRNAKCQYRMFKHEHEKENRENQMAFRMLNTVFERQDIEGVNSVTYTVMSKVQTRLFTNITIDVGTPSERMMALHSDQTEHKKCDGSVFLEPDVW